jgi:hypothetical protein
LRDPGLLQNDFRKPDFIGVLRVSPGKVTLVVLVPVDDFFGEISLLHFLDNQNFSILFLIQVQQINFALPKSK